MLSKFTIAAGLAALATEISAASSPCVQVNTTLQGLNFHVVSSNSLTNNRNIQLRPNQYETEFGFPAGTFHYVGLDLHSPVLRASLNSGLLVSDGADACQEGYVNVEQVIGNTTQYLFSFGNTTLYPAAADPNWYLAYLGGDDLYGLYHEEPLEVVNGFVLCEADFDLDYGPWYDLTYVTYIGTPAELDSSCEYVGIQTTVSPADQVCSF